MKNKIIIMNFSIYLIFYNSYQHNIVIVINKLNIIILYNDYKKMYEYKQILSIVAIIKILKQTISMSEQISTYMIIKCMNVRIYLFVVLQPMSLGITLL